MRVRTLVVLAVMALLYVLLQVDVTLPALSVAGLVAWAVFSSVLAVVYARRNHIDRKG